MSREYVLQPFRGQVDLQIDYAKELNAQQHAAVTAPPGPSLVLAGAGAGKTRTLIYRVAFLLEQGVPPDRILLLTFTNKAAREMMRRVDDLLGNDLSGLWGGTFHSVGHRMLRKHASQVGYRADFTILDREDAKDLIKTCVGEMNIETQGTRFPKADVLQDILSLSVNTNRSIRETIAAQYEYFADVSAVIQEIAQKYEARKRLTNVMDFDDLLVLWLRLLQEHPETQEFYQRKFQFLLVDEYQDTNKIQADIIDLIAARHTNVMVVGDDSQSIYSWRGANFLNILEFPKRYAAAKIYKIETNYRSTPEILALANAAIKANQHQFPKELAPARPSGIKPALVPCGSAGEQAAFVAQRMLELREEGAELNNMAVLYRSHFHALELQLELTRRNIPFSITSGIRFFEQAHLKDAIAYLKFACNPRDELSFKRLVQMLPGVGGKGAHKIWTKFGEVFDFSTVDAGEQPEGKSFPLATALQKCSDVIGAKTAKAWSNFAITISQLEEPKLRSDPSQMLQTVLEGPYEDYLKATYTNYKSRTEDLEQLANFAHQFKTIEEFLTQLSLLTNLEAEDSGPSSKDTEQVRLSTIHQAKGLEFDVVFVIMLCDGLFPSARSLDDYQAEEEERRLFYVALTRARNELYLSYPLIRFSHGYGGDQMQEPSRFLKEFEKNLVEEWNLRPYHSYM